MALYLQAERLVVDDAVICPLYYVGMRQLVRSDVRGYFLNALDRRDLSAVWFEKRK